MLDEKKTAIEAILSVLQERGESSPSDLLLALTDRLISPDDKALVTLAIWELLDQGKLKLTERRLLSLDHIATIS